MQVPFETPEQRLLQVEHELGLLKRSLGGIASIGALTSTEIFVFDDGSMPVRQTEGAIGYDAFARAVVDPLAKPTENNPLRRTVADFKLGDDWEERIDTEVKEWVVPDADDPNKYAISLPPQKRLMVGLGFATKMHFPMFYWVAPRSGYAARGITVANSPGTVDPDYRGEAGALIENNSKEDFIISHHMRVVQVIFSFALIPELTVVDQHDQLGSTTRGAGGFGSTGTHSR